MGRVTGVASRYVSAVGVSERIIAVEAELPPAERRVAELVLRDAGAVAFGTVAEVAATSDTSGPTVVRLATRLGFGGFADLQAAIRDEVTDRLRPAADRIRDRPVPDAVAGTLAAELENVHATLEGMSTEAYTTAVGLLAGRSQRVAVMSGDASHGVAHLFASNLGMIRPGVALVSGTATRVTRDLALLDPGDVVVALDLRRYERWLLNALDEATRVGAVRIAITDSAISPVATGSAATFVVAADSPGPFDSHVGSLALCNALVAGAAARLRRSASDRLDRVEQAWRAHGDLSE